MRPIISTKVQNLNKHRVTSHHNLYFDVFQRKFDKWVESGTEFVVNQISETVKVEENETVWFDPDENFVFEKISLFY